MILLTLGCLHDLTLHILAPIFPLQLQTWNAWLMMPSDPLEVQDAPSANACLQIQAHEAKVHCAAAATYWQRPPYLTRW